MKILGKILSFITNPKNLRTIVFAGGIILLILFLQQCNRTGYWKSQTEIEKNEKLRVQNNYYAAMDTIKQKKLDEDTWIAEKSGYELTLSEIKEEYIDLLVDFNIEKNKPPKTIIKTVYEIKDSIKNVPIFVETDSLGNKNLSFSDSTHHDSSNYRYLSGKIPYETFYDKKDIKIVPGNGDFSLTLGMNLNLALLQDKKTRKISIVATTNYPNVNFTKLDGVNVIDDPKNKKMFRHMRKTWGIGVNIGYGTLLDYKSKTIGVGPYVGVGINYSPKFLQWGK